MEPYASIIQKKLLKYLKLNELWGLGVCLISLSSCRYNCILIRKHKKSK